METPILKDLDEFADHELIRVGNQLQHKLGKEILGVVDISPEIEELARKAKIEFDVKYPLSKIDASQLAELIALHGKEILNSLDVAFATPMPHP